jgi:hypothetical protein
VPAGGSGAAHQGGPLLGTLWRQRGAPTQGAYEVVEHALGRVRVQAQYGDACASMHEAELRSLWEQIDGSPITPPAERYAAPGQDGGDVPSAAPACGTCGDSGEVNAMDYTGNTEDCPACSDKARDPVPADMPPLCCQAHPAEPDAGCPKCADGEPPSDPLEPYRTNASTEQRAACLHPPDDRAPLSGDGWLCCLCGADCAPPSDAPGEITADRLCDLEQRARETFARASFAAEPEKILAAAALALSAEVQRLRAAATPPVASSAPAVPESHAGGPGASSTPQGVPCASCGKATSTGGCFACTVAGRFLKPAPIPAKPAQVLPRQHWRCVGLEAHGELEVWPADSLTSPGEVPLFPVGSGGTYGRIRARIIDMLGLREWSFVSGPRE